jgi:hypothetical protein
VIETAQQLGGDEQHAGRRRHRVERVRGGGRRGERDHPRGQRPAVATGRAVRLHCGLLADMASISRAVRVRVAVPAWLCGTRRAAPCHSASATLASCSGWSGMPIRGAPGNPGVHALGLDEDEAARPGPDHATRIRTFRLIVLLAQELRTLMDQLLRADGLTTQQAALIAVVEATGAPSLSQSRRRARHHAPERQADRRRARAQGIPAHRPRRGRPPRLPARHHGQEPPRLRVPVPQACDRRDDGRRPHSPR